MFNILVGQSGGPTAVINASLYGVIDEGMNSSKVDVVYGMNNGIEGFLSDKIYNISKYLQKESIDLLKSTPASFLGSCRYRLPENLDSEIYTQIFKKLEGYDIKAFIYIGGNDSMDTVSKLSKYAKKIGSDICFIGVPKTIDNDLLITDHTPGYGSTAKHVATTVREIALDASVYEYPVVTIVELMGRNAGWVTAASVLARTAYDDNPMLIYLPEVAFEVDKFVNDVKQALENNNSVIVCVSEGISLADGTLVCEMGNDVGTDTFGHKMLTGCGKVLENVIKEEIGCKCRSIEVNLLQRCSAVLASKVDIDEAEMVGRFGLQQAINGYTGQMIAIRRIEKDYKTDCILVDVDDICNKEKKFPKQWIINNGTDISKEFLDYVLPLIQGENTVKFENGLPVYLKPVYFDEI